MEALVLLFILFLGIGPAFYGLILHGAFTAVRSRIRRVWNEIETELTRRRAVIPRLVTSASRLGACDPKLLATLRALCAENGDSTRTESGGELEVAAALRQFVSQMAVCPAAESDKEFQDTQADLFATEARLNAKRDLFNTEVRAYERRRICFPDSIVAKMFGFDAIGMFPDELLLRVDAAG